MEAMYEAATELRAELDYIGLQLKAIRGAYEEDLEAQKLQPPHVASLIMSRLVVLCVANNGGIHCSKEQLDAIAESSLRAHEILKAKHEELQRVVDVQEKKELGE